MIRVENDSADVQASPIFEILDTTSDRGYAFQGGTRSGKTYNILLWIVCSYCMQNTGKVISIVRGTLPSLKGSVLRDLIEILESLGLYSDSMHHKQDMTLSVNGNIIEYFSVDDEIKVRGRKRNLLFVNEANQIAYDKFQQLIFRTSERIIIDWNPSDIEGWVYKFAERTDTLFHVSTYKDNPFLPQVLIDEIERLATEDPIAWRVYGLGQKAKIRGLVFNRWEVMSEPPKSRKLDTIYGLDFGFSSSPTALVQVDIYENGFLYITEVIYATGLTTGDLLEAIDQLLPNTATIYADSAEPDRIEEMYRAGWDVHKALKEVSYGIELVQRFPLGLDENSKNVVKEFSRYKFKQDALGEVLPVPAKIDDHTPDATRYAVATHYHLYGAVAFGNQDSPIEKLLSSKRTKRSTKQRIRIL